MEIIKKTRRGLGRIGVLMGGPSTEREISLKSGKAVYEALEELGLEVSAIDIKTDNVEENGRLIKSHKINCAFLALHGRFGEDGQMQNILENINISYTGSGPKASRLAMDKIDSRLIFESRGLRVPRCAVIDRQRSKENYSHYKNLGLPLVIKPAAGGSSIGLSIIDKKKDLEAALDAAFSCDKKIIIEEYIPGREVTVGILDASALPAIEIVTKKRFFDYEAKYKPGLTDYVVPAKLKLRAAARIKKAALLAHKLLGCCGCSRVDMILNKEGEPVVLEVNTIPGLTETSLLPKAAASCGIGFGELCIQLIKLAYEKKKSPYTG